jgi:hypothetical protein
MRYKILSTAAPMNQPQRSRGPILKGTVKHKRKLLFPPCIIVYTFYLLVLYTPSISIYCIYQLYHCAVYVCAKGFLNRDDRFGIKGYKMGQPCEMRAAGLDEVSRG